MTRQRYVMALDQGTTSSRCILFDEAGSPVRTVQRGIRQIYPRPGWVEHDPMEIWGSQAGAASEALATQGASAEEIAAVGIANQRETTVVWDRATGRPFHNAIVWQCRRTADMCERLRADGFAGPVLDKTGLHLDAYFSATKLAWLLDAVPGLRERARDGEALFGTVDAWLLWRLTRGKVHATDYTNASRTMLFNIHTLEWDADILDRLGVPRAMLPRVEPSSTPYGATATGLFGAEIPITGVAGDQQAALFGQLCHGAGQAKNTYGTGCFLLMHTGGRAVRSGHGLLTTITASTGTAAEYALEGSIFTGGAAVQWLRDELGVVGTAAETEVLARSLADNAGVYLVPAFVGLGAPHWNSRARGAVFGLTRGAGRAHLARAALESMAYQTFDILQAMEKDAGTPLSVLKIDGGAAGNDFLAQFQSDILDREVVRPAVTETTALGAAYLAGLRAGFWGGVGEIRAGRGGDVAFSPRMARDARERNLAGWRAALASALQWAK